LYRTLCSIAIAAAIVAAMAIGSLLKRPLPSPARFPRPRRDLLPAAVAAAFILIPIIALTALPSKSPVVAGICAVPAAIACALAYHRCAGRVFGPAMRAFLSLAACAAGILAFAFHIRSDRPDDSYGRAIGRLYSSIVRLADRRGVSTPRIGFLTTNDDAFFSGSLNVWAYENLGRLLRATDALGGIQMFSATSGEILSGLDAADIILLPDHPVSGIYPFDASIARDFGMIRTYCRDNMTVGEVVDVPGDSISVCARVFLSPVDLSGTWVTSDGCRFPLPRLDKRGPLRVRAEFRVPEYAHYRDLRASVSRLAAGGSDGVAQGTLSWRTARGAPNLALEVEMPGAAFDGREFLGIKFNRFFVPKELGLNNDIRRLSVEFVRAYIVSE